jgi:hypothetical protein
MKSRGKNLSALLFSLALITKLAVDTIITYQPHPDSPDFKEKKMSFFNKIKQSLGIGTLAAKLDAPGQIARSSGQIEGNFVLTAKSDQRIKEIKIKFEEIHSWDVTKQRRDSKGRERSYTARQSRTFELGNYTDNTPFVMKAGEVKTIHFTLPFQISRASMEAPDNQSAVAEILGAVSKMASAMRNERFQYKIEGNVSLEGTLLNPGDSKNVVLV